MRLREIDSWSDYFQYFYEIYNPFSYARFLMQEDKDWGEKAEHTAAATFTVAFPFHAYTAMSTGGYWANLPPGSFYRASSMKNFTNRLFYNFIRNSLSVGSRVHPAAVLAAVAVGSTAGWIATADVHGAVVPGVASGIGIPMGPTTGGSLDNPLGLTWGSLSTSISSLMPGFLR